MRRWQVQVNIGSMAAVAGQEGREGQKTEEGIDDGQKGFLSRLCAPYANGKL